MSRKFVVLLCVAVMSGCVHYSTPTVVPAGTRVGAPVDSNRVFFDSLAHARAADTLSREAPPRPAVPRTLGPDAVGELAWLDVLQDSTLISLARTALRDNRELLTAQARIREYRAAASEVRAGFFPSLTLNATVARNKSAFGSLTIPPYTAWRTTADVAWDVNLFGNSARLSAARFDVAAQESLERATTLALIADVASGYLQLLELDQENEIAQQTLASRRATLNLAQQRYGQGIISELDVRQFEAQVAVPAVHLAQVQQARARAEHALNVLLGEGPAPIPRGNTLARAARAVVVPDSVPVALIERRPDVEAARRQLDAAAARIGVAVAQRLPSLSIIGSYGGQAQSIGSLTDPSSRVYQLLAGISLPIFRGGALNAEQRLARARADEARAQYGQTVLTALQEAGDALAAVRAQNDQLVAQETQATALRRALELATMRYRSGISNYLEVLEAQRSVFDAELAESQAELQQLLATVELYKALGGRW